MSIINTIRQYVQSIMSKNDPSHDMDHIERVVSIALNIAKNESITDNDTIEIIELGALCHDLCDYKYQSSIVSLNILEALFVEQSYPRDKMDRVFHIINHIGYSKRMKRIEEGIDTIIPKNNELDIHSENEPMLDPTIYTIELCIVSDADMIDALGSIGIARCLYFGATKLSPLYDLNNIENPKTIIGHYYDKLFKLPSLMLTKRGKEIAYDKVKIMHLFISAIEKEINMII